SDLSRSSLIRRGLRGVSGSGHFARGGPSVDAARSFVLPAVIPLPPAPDHDLAAVFCPALQLPCSSLLTKIISQSHITPSLDEDYQPGHRRGKGRRRSARGPSAHHCWGGVRAVCTHHGVGAGWRRGPERTPLPVQAPLHHWCRGNAFCSRDDDPETRPAAARPTPP